MSLSKTIAILIWLMGLFGFLVGVLERPPIDKLQLIPPLPEVVVLFPAIFLTAGSFWGRYPFDVQWLRTWIDRRRGLGTYARFMRDLKPMLGFAVFANVGAVVCVLQNYRTTAPVDAYWACGFGLSLGIGFVAARFVLARRGLLMESWSPSATRAYGPWGTEQ